MSQLTTVAFKATLKKKHIISSLFGSKGVFTAFAVNYAEPVENTWFKNSSEPLFLNLGVLYCGVFSDRETLELSTDPSKLIGIAKLYYNVLVTSPVIIRFFLNVFSCRFYLAI